MISKITFCVLLASVSLGNAAMKEDVIVVKKFLKNGAPTPQSLTFTLMSQEDSTQEKTLKVSWDHPIAVESSSIYFANENQEITQYTFADKTATITKFAKPWNKSTETTVATESTSNKGDQVIDLNVLPVNTTLVSASAVVKGEIYNYYGIQNFDISLPDVQITKSYQPVDLTAVTEN